MEKIWRGYGENLEWRRYGEDMLTAEAQTGDATDTGCGCLNSGNNTR